jgi:hypothetical protein
MFGQGLNAGILASYTVADPTITLVSRDDASITFTIRNNDGAQAVINYEHTDTTPDAANVTVAGGATSSNLTISSLSAGTSYTIYVQATISGLENSAAVSLSTATLSFTTLGSEYDKSSGSSLFGTYNSGTWWMPVFSNSSVSATTWRLEATSAAGNVSNEYWTSIHVEDNGGTTYNSYSAVTPTRVGYMAGGGSNDNAFNGSNFAVSPGNGNHVGSYIQLVFPSAVTLNKLWIQTGYTKIDGMTLKYLG